MEKKQKGSIQERVRYKEEPRIVRYRNNIYTIKYVDYIQRTYLYYIYADEIIEQDRDAILAIDMDTLMTRFVIKKNHNKFDFDLAKQLILDILEKREMRWSEIPITYSGIDGIKRECVHTNIPDEDINVFGITRDE